MNPFRSLKDDDTESASAAKFFCRPILIMIIIGVVIRLVLGFFTTQIYDMFHWGRVIQNIESGNGLYEITGFFYTPVWGYILGVVSFFQDLIGVTVIGETLTEAIPLEDIAWYFTANVTTPLFNFTLKLIFLISDLVVGYLIFWIIRDITGDRRKSIIGFALWFLCPFVIASGALKGMFDTISVLMTLLSIIMLRKDRYIESGVMISLAALMKFFPAFFVFLFIGYIISKNRKDGAAKKKTAMFLAGVAIMSFVIFLPQLLDGTIADCFLFITSRLSDGVGLDNLGAMGGYVALAVYVAVIAVSIFFSIRIIKNDDDVKRESLLFDGLLIIVTVMFLYPPLPQYVLLLLPFILFAMVSDRRYIIPLILLMIGTTIASFSNGLTSLVAIAAYTNLLDLESLMRSIDIFTSMFLGERIMLVIGYLGSFIQYIGILYVLWVRFGETIKKKISDHRNKQKESTQ